MQVFVGNDFGGTPLAERSCVAQNLVLLSVHANDKGNLVCTVEPEDASTKIYLASSECAKRFGGTWVKETSTLTVEVGAKCFGAITKGKIVTMTGQASPELSATQKAEVLRLTNMGVAPATAMIEARKIA